MQCTNRYVLLHRVTMRYGVHQYVPNPQGDHVPLHRITVIIILMQLHLVQYHLASCEQFCPICTIHLYRELLLGKGLMHQWMCHRVTVRYCGSKMYVLASKTGQCSPTMCILFTALVPLSYFKPKAPNTGLTALTNTNKKFLCMVLERNHYKGLYKMSVAVPLGTEDPSGLEPLFSL